MCTYMSMSMYVYVYVSVGTGNGKDEKVGSLQLTKAKVNLDTGQFIFTRVLFLLLW